MALDVAAAALLPDRAALGVVNRHRRRLALAADDLAVGGDDATGVDLALGIVRDRVDVVNRALFRVGLGEFPSFVVISKQVFHEFLHCLARGQMGPHMAIYCMGT